MRRRAVRVGREVCGEQRARFRYTSQLGLQATCQERGIGLCRLRAQHGLRLRQRALQLRPLLELLRQLQMTGNVRERESLRARFQGAQRLLPLAEKEQDLAEAEV